MFLDAFEKISALEEVDLKQLPTMADFTDIQTMLIWLINTWMCGAEREGLVESSEMQNMRNNLLSEISSMFKHHFKCDSFIFRDRPQFNIGHFLQKETV